MMHDILLNLNQSSAHIKASAIISTDGMVIVSALEHDMDVDNVGAMTAAVLAVSTHSIEKFLGGELEHVLIKGTDGYILMTHAGKEAVLTVITHAHDQLDITFSAIKRSALEIKRSTLNNQ